MELSFVHFKKWSFSNFWKDHPFHSLSFDYFYNQKYLPTATATHKQKKNIQYKHRNRKKIENRKHKLKTETKTENKRKHKTNTQTENGKQNNWEKNSFISKMENRKLFYRNRKKKLKTENEKKIN